MEESEIRNLIVEALYKSEDLAESNKAFDGGIMEELKKRIPGLTDESFEDQLNSHLKGLAKIRESIKQGADLDSAFRVHATGTGILLDLQKTMRSLRIAKQEGFDQSSLKEKLVALNQIRIQRVGGTENDQISQSVIELLK